MATTDAALKRYREPQSAETCANRIRAARNPPAFDAADINHSDRNQSSCAFQNGRLACTNLQLRVFIARVWMMTPDDVIGPSWVDDVRIDIIAKAASPKTPDGELRLMAQTLLTQSIMPEKREDSDCSFVSGGPGPHLLCKHMTMAPVDSMSRTPEN